MNTKLLATLTFICLPNLLTACDQNKATAIPAEQPANFAQPQMDAYKKAQQVQSDMEKVELQKKDDMKQQGL